MKIRGIRAAVNELTPAKLNFWYFQIGGWLGYESFTIMRRVIQLLKENQPFASASKNFYSLLIYGLASLILTSLVRYPYRIIYRRQLPIGLTILWISLISVVITFVATYFGNFLYSWWVEPYSSSDFMVILWLVLYNFPSFFGWSVLYFGIKYWIQWSYERARADKADRLAQAAQLQMLRYQLNPHFLFNSLNSIRALINEDQKASREMVTELAEFLRYSLVNKGSASVPLSQEIDAIRHYFAIEKKRFDEKLEVEIRISPEAESFPVLGFLLHPLVENAVKYGMKTSPMPLKIGIHADVGEECLLMRVENTGSWIDEQKNHDKEGTGTGLANIRMRLENAYPGQYSFEIGQEGGQVVARIRICRQIKVNSL
jgi:two-component sensor histidine kinase